jgi:rhomboid protease GluP
LDTNLVFLLMSAVMASATLAQIARIRPPEALSYAVAPALVLSVAAVGYLLRPGSAGYAAAAALVIFMVLPGYAALPVGRAIMTQRFKRARVFAWIAAVLNPTAPRRRALRTISQLEAIEAGRLHAADLDARDMTPPMRSIYPHALRAEARYADIVAYVRSLPAAERERDLGLLGHEVRALGEVGRYEEMIALARSIAQQPGALHFIADVRMMALAFLGQTQLVEHLTAQREAVLGRSIAAFWRATARAVAGDPSSRASFEALAATGASVRKAAQHRLAQPPPAVDLDAVPSARAFIEEITAEEASSAGLRPGKHRLVATSIWIALLCAAFGAQVPGGTTDVMNLVELGALVVPATEGYDQPWRLLSAAFLHYGATHLVLNLLGFWALGRRIEGALGGWKLSLLFLGSALLGNLAALFWMSSPGVVVGASGGVLGLLGALVAIVLYRRRQRRTRYLTGVLREVGAVVLMQAVFDFLMPNIGTLVHVAGFAGGVVLGFLLIPAEKRAAV